MNNVHCPVCDEALCRTIDTNGGDILTEETQNCSCGYHFEFMYGHYFEHIGDTEFEWSNQYIDPNSKAPTVHERQKAIIKALQVLLKKTKICVMTKLN